MKFMRDKLAADGGSGCHSVEKLLKLATDSLSNFISDRSGVFIFMLMESIRISGATGSSANTSVQLKSSGILDSTDSLAAVSCWRTYAIVYLVDAMWQAARISPDKFDVDTFKIVTSRNGVLKIIAEIESQIREAKLVEFWHYVTMLFLLTN